MHKDYGDVQVLATEARRKTLSVEVHPTGQVVLRAHRSVDGQQLLLQVIDTGCGIALDQQARIFEKFSQGNARVSYQHGGTGLGLSLSRALAELLGGSLNLHSREGEGATFTIALPLAVRGA